MLPGVPISLPFGDHTVHGVGNAARILVEPHVAKQHGSRENQRRWVGLIFALDVQADVTAAGLEDGDLATDVATRHNARAAHQPGTDVGQDAAVEIGHDHDIELLRSRNALHRRVVDNHVVGLHCRVVLSNLPDRLAEEPVSQLHDVGLVDTRDLLAVVGEREGKGEPGYALRLDPRDDLERLDDAGHRLVLQARVLALCVLANDGQVDVVMARLVAGDVLDQHDRCIDVKFLTESNVEGRVSGPVDGSVQYAWPLSAASTPLGDC